MTPSEDMKQKRLAEFEKERYFIKNDYNGFITPIRDTKKTTEILQKLYNNEEFRISISENSIKTAKKFSWENYFEQFKTIFVK